MNKVKPHIFNGASHIRKIAAKILLAVIIASIGVIQRASGQSADMQASQDEKTQLQRELNDIENQIAAYQRELNNITGEKKTLQNKIRELEKQKASLNLQIRATSLRIAELGSQITVTENAIDANTKKIAALKTQLAEAIRSINEQDASPLWSQVLSHDNLSDVLSELEYASEISQNLSTLVTETKTANDQLAADKIKLADQQDQAQNLLSIQSLQKDQLAGSESEQNTLLTQTRGRENEYQSVLRDSQKKASEIRSRLYQLIGVPTQITFGEAVTIAKWAGSQTGVRPAFLLAILTQESNLGKNVGTCNRPGDGPEKSWRQVMKPDRDAGPFQEITSGLGMDPDITPVSCPMRDHRGRQIGWGGAMGPAQFIPSTWMGYRDQVSARTGKGANPWDIRDAFLASALKLAGAGAVSQSGEWAAAMRYFSGGTSARFRFYGDNVVKTANQYQSDIDELNQ